MGGRGASNNGDPRKRYQNSNKQALIDAAKDSDNAIEFWMSLTPDQQKQFKNMNEIERAFEELKQQAGEKEEWKAPTGSIREFDDIAVDMRGKNLELKLIDGKNSGWMAHATYADEIAVRKEGLGDNWKGILDHEIGHQLSNASNELGLTIMRNPENVFGRYNTRLKGFDGVYGEYSPEEAFATAYSNYLNHPLQLKEKYPKLYDVVDKVYKNGKGIREYTEKAEEAYKRRFGIK